MYIDKIMCYCFNIREVLVLLVFIVTFSNISVISARTDKHRQMKSPALCVYLETLIKVDTRQSWISIT